MAAKKTKKTKAVVKKSAAKVKSAKAAKGKKPAKAVTKAVVKAVAKKPAPIPPSKPVLVSPKNTGTKQYSQSEFFDCVQGCCGFHSRKDAKTFYGNFSGMLQSALKNGYKVVLPGLGKLQVRRTKARKGINPATREPIMIPARKKVAFTALKVLKQSVL